MAESLADGYVRIRPDTSRLGGDLETQGRRQVASHGKRLGFGFSQSFGGGFRAGVGGALKGALIGGAALVGIHGVIEGFKSLVEQGRDVEKQQRITAAVIKSTGGVANVTAGNVDKLTRAIGEGVGVDDDLIRTSSNLLLTFKNVRNANKEGQGTFTSAQQAIVDMTAAMHKGTVDAAGLRSSTIAVGKALNDPIKGMTALSRVGVTFDEQQKKQIENLTKRGKLTQAQGLILRELGSEFGGAAHASADGTQRLAAQFDNIRDDIAVKVVPWLEKGAGAVSQFLSEMKSGEGAGGRFAAIMKQTGAIIQTYVLPPLLTVGRFIVGTVVPALVSMAKWGAEQQAWLVPVAAGIVAIVAALKVYAAIQAVVATATKVWAAAQLLLDAALAANPIGLIVLAVIGLATALVVAYKRSETFRKVVNAAMRGVAIVVGNVVAFLVDGFRHIFDVWALVWGNIIGGLANIARKLHLPFAGALTKISNSFNATKERVDNTLKGIADSARRWGEAATEHLSDAGTSSGKRFTQGLANAIRSNSRAPVAAAQGTANKVRAAGANLGAAGYAAGREFVNGLTAALQNSGAPEAAARGIANKVAAAYRAEQQSHSPSRVAIRLGGQFVDGIVVGLTAGQARAANAAKNLTQAVAGQVSKAVDAAKQKLQSMRQVSRDLAASVRDAVKGSFDPTAAPGVAGFQAGLHRAAAQAGQFVRALRILVRRHFPRALIEQIATAGPVEGLQIARSLAASTGAQAADIRRTYRQLDVYAGRAGAAVGAMDRHAIAVQERQLKHLQEIERSVKRAERRHEHAELAVRNGQLLVRFVKDQEKRDKRRGGNR